MDSDQLALVAALQAQQRQQAAAMHAALQHQQAHQQPQAQTPQQMQLPLPPPPQQPPPLPQHPPPPQQQLPGQRLGLPLEPPSSKPSKRSPAGVAATASANSAADSNAPPKSAFFGEPPAHASSGDGGAALPSEYLVVNGFHYRIPPLYDQMHTMSDEPNQSEYASYAQWARAQSSMRGGAGSTKDNAAVVGGSGGRGDASGGGGSSDKPAAAARGRGRGRGRGRPSLASRGAESGLGGEARSPSAELGGMATGEGGGAVPGSGGLGEGGGAMDEARDELDRWRRAWSVVVRRDILRQQRAVVTSHKDMLVMLKRTAIATQKEVRKRALRAQRLSSNPVIQLR